MRTTHEDKVAKLMEIGLESVNGMWLTLLTHGTQEAQDQYEAAAKDAGYTLMATMLWAK